MPSDDSDRHNALFTLILAKWASGPPSFPKSRAGRIVTVAVEGK
jgi:hypothetical protein